MAAGRGRLLVVGTPIGNLGDLTPRAADALRTADLVVAEVQTALSVDLRVRRGIDHHRDLLEVLGRGPQHRGALIPDGDFRRAHPPGNRA